MIDGAVAGRGGRRGVLRRNVLRQQCVPHRMTAMLRCMNPKPNTSRCVDLRRLGKRRIGRISDQPSVPQLNRAVSVAAFASECVTCTMVVPCWLSSRKSSMISLAWPECRFPVGSSASSSGVCE